MRFFKSAVKSTLLLAASATAQVATYTNNGHALSVNIPASSASSGQGPIYFQISAPSGTSWVAFGQGSRMAGANMFVVYAQSSTNVTLSARAGTGHNMPEHDSSVQVSLLEGSGVASDGSMVANVRCDNCNSWSGGSMSFTDSSSSWIYASRSGSALNSDDVGASISQHNSDTTFSVDLTQGTGGSSSNPFVAAADTPSESASASASGSGASATRTGGTVSTPTGGVSSPVASSGSTSGSSGSTSASANSSDNTSTLMNAHGIIMSLLFVGLFPLISLTLYLNSTKKVRYIHAPLQLLSVILLIAGMSLGIVLGQRIGELDGYHMIIGFIVVAALVLFQPAMGIYQHLCYHKTGGKTVFGILHRWLGRTMIILGIINGGLGWQLTGNTSAYIPYGIVAALVFLIYISVLAFAWYRSGQQTDLEIEKASSDRSYEMQNPRGLKHQRLPSNPTNTNNQSMYAQQQQSPHKGSYTISNRA